MDPKVVETQVNENDEHHPLNAESQVVHGSTEEVHSDNENSVLKKVRAKAKKIKETFKKHGHHVLDHVHGSYNNNQDDHHNQVIENEESLESATPTSEKIDNLEKSGDNFEDTKVMRQESSHDEPRVLDVSPTNETDQNIVTDSAKTFVGEVKPEQCVDKIDIKPVMREKSSHQPQVVGVSQTTEFDQNIVTDSDKALFVGEEKPEHCKVNLDSQTGLEEDPRVPESKTEAYTSPNFQTKVNDPTGAVTGIDEIYMKPVEESFARMNVQDEQKSKPEPPIFAETHHDKFLADLSSESKTQNPSAEIHVHQHLPELSSATKTQHEQFVTEVSDSTEQSFITTTPTVEEQQPCQEPVEKLANQNTNTSEIFSATSEISDKDVSAENAVSTKFSYGEKDDDTENKVKPHEEPKSEDKIKGVSSSVKDYLSEKLRPSEEDRALSEVISEALNKRKEEPKKVVPDSIDKREEEIVCDEVNNSPREGVVDKLKGVVGSWFTKSGENQSSQGGQDLSTNNKDTPGEAEQIVSQAEPEKKP